MTMKNPHDERRKREFMILKAHLQSGVGQRASHIVLKRGIYKRGNPSEEVLCPVLASGDKCHKYVRTGFRTKGHSHEFFRPQLLVQHHSIPNLQLWRCEGCPRFLLRVEVEKTC